MTKFKYCEQCIALQAAALTIPWHTNATPSAATKKNKHSTLIYRDQFIATVTAKVDNATASQANR